MLIYGVADVRVVDGTDDFGCYGYALARFHSAGFFPSTAASRGTSRHQSTSPQIAARTTSRTLIGPLTSSRILHSRWFDWVAGEPLKHTEVPNAPLENMRVRQVPVRSGPCERTKAPNGHNQVRVARAQQGAERGARATREAAE